MLVRIVLQAIVNAAVGARVALDAPAGTEYRSGRLARVRAGGRRAGAYVVIVLEDSPDGGEDSGF